MDYVNKLKTLTPLQIGIAAAVAAILVYGMYTLYRSTDGFSNFTGLKKKVDHRMTDNNTEAQGSQQNSPGDNATGKGESAENPLRDEAPRTMATPYTTQP